MLSLWIVNISLSKSVYLLTVWFGLESSAEFMYLISTWPINHDMPTTTL